MTKPPGKFEKRAGSRTRGARRLQARGRSLIATALCVPWLALSAGAGPAFAPPALLNSNGISDSGSDGEPQIATDGGGNWVA
ncbi:MAG: hypothetical protein AAEJ53_06660, partial [Myxococcota bacterium]